jgi:hypothetical protein
MGSNYYDKNKSDLWGYYNETPENWSLSRILTPIGTTIEIEYESDSYHNFAAFNDVFSVLDIKEVGPAGNDYDFSHCFAG